MIHLVDHRSPKLRMDEFIEGTEYLGELSVLYSFFLLPYSPTSQLLHPPHSSVPTTSTPPPSAAMLPASISNQPSTLLNFPQVA